MLTVEECIGKIVLIRDTERYTSTIRYEETKFLTLSPSKKFVKVQWNTKRIEWLARDDFEPTTYIPTRYRIEEILGNILPRRRYEEKNLGRDSINLL